MSNCNVAPKGPCPSGEARGRGSQGQGGARGARRGQSQFGGCPHPAAPSQHPALPPAASPCHVSKLQTLEQKPAAGKTNSPILHANGNPAPSRFPSIYFWVLLEKKKKKNYHFCQTVGVTEGGGRLQRPGSPGRAPWSEGRAHGNILSPRDSAGPSESPTLQGIPASPAPPRNHAAGDHFPAGAGFGSREKGPSPLTTSCGFYGGVFTGGWINPCPCQGMGAKGARPAWQQPPGTSPT